MSASAPDPSVHEYFSKHCFNQTWNYLDLESRTPEDEEEMLRLTLASHWHWTQRSDDYTPVKASVAYWQASRVLAKMGEANLARRFGQRSLDVVKDMPEEGFYRGFAHEALARAEAVAGNAEAMKKHLAAAEKEVDALDNPEFKQMILVDLETVELGSS